VWSTDWWIDADGTIEKLDVTLRQVLESSRNRRAQQAAHNEAETAIAEAIAKAQGVLHSHPRPELEVMTPKASTADVYRAALQSPDTAAFKVAEIPAETYARNIAGVEKSSSPAFMESDPAAEIDGIDANAFFQRSYEPILSRMVAHVVEREGPVLDAVLARRIARAHGWQRTGAKIQERVEALAAKSHVSTEENVGTFYWARGRGPDVPVSFRRADDGMRTVDEICMEELTSLATQIISSGFRGDDAILGMARELGLQRLRSASRERLEKAMTRVGLIEARVDFSDSEFLAFVSENALSHKDHRLRGGALWVEGSVIDPGVISQLQRWGFKNKEEKGWWRT
jgi:hypothetical protein